MPVLGSISALLPFASIKQALQRFLRNNSRSHRIEVDIVKSAQKQFPGSIKIPL